ncbi:hypothetical protein [Mesobacillus boroniphilus]|nr:hypothetical protein [Mesobacillus boroniphilus]
MTSVSFSLLTKLKVRKKPIVIDSADSDNGVLANRAGLMEGI